MADRSLQGTLSGSGNAATASSSTTFVPAAGAGDDSSVKTSAGGGPKKKGRVSRDAASIKRRCVSTACIACRKRKSKCDGNTPSCAACSSVYGTGKLFSTACFSNTVASWLACTHSLASLRIKLMDEQNVYMTREATIDGKECIKTRPKH